MYKGDTMREENLKDIREKLQLYPIRTIKIEDMKLELEELELGETLKSQGYEEAVQCSPRCKNNDELIYKKNSLKARIAYYETVNKRVDNWLNLIKTLKAKEAIICIYINKMSKTQAAKRLDRCRRQIDNLVRQGEEEIYNSIYNKSENFHKVS